MQSRTRRYYFGSYGVVRGYGPLLRSLREADDSIQDDDRRQRQQGGCSDRHVVIVSADTGQCWHFDEGETVVERSRPVMTPAGKQAVYLPQVVKVCEQSWLEPREIAGFR